MVAIKRYVAIASIALSLILLGYVLYPALSSFTGPLSDLPIYVGAPQPYSYILDTNGTHYFSFNGTTGYNTQTTDNASDLIDNLVFDNTSILLRVGNYPIQYRITLDVQDFALVGEVSEGVQLTFSGNGEFYVSHGSTNREHYRFEDLTFIGDDPAKAGFNTSGIASNKRFGQARFIRCRWQNWANSSAWHNYAFHISNFDYVTFDNCFWYDAPIFIASHGWAAGNLDFVSCFFGTEIQYSGYNMIVLQSDGGGVGGIYWHGRNQFYAANALSPNYHTYAVMANATNNDITYLTFENVRCERVELLRTFNNGTSNAEKITIANSPSLNPSKTDAISIYLDVYTEFVSVIGNRFLGSGYANETCIWNNGGAKGTPRQWCSISDNIYGGDTFINGTGYNHISNNPFYNPVGNLTNPHSLDGGNRYLRDFAGTGAIQNETLYTNVDSPKAIYMQDADTFDVYVNGDLVFNDVTQAMVYLASGETFEIQWVSTLTTLEVMGE